MPPDLSFTPVDHDPFADESSPQLERIPPQTNVPAQQQWGAQKATDMLGSVTGISDAAKAARGEMTPEEAKNFALLAAAGMLPMGKALGPAARAAEDAAPSVAKGIRAYHGSFDLEGAFNPYHTNELGPHFGDLTQANTRLKKGNLEEGARIVPVELDFKNPLHMRDVTYWEPANVVNQLGKMTDEKDSRLFIAAELAPIWSNYRKWKKSAFYIADRDPQMKNRMIDQIRELLESKGYDSIKYQNQWEGQTSKAKNVSYIPIKRDTVTSALTGSTLFGGLLLIPVEYDPFAPGRAAGGRVLASNIDGEPTEAQKIAGNYAKDHVSIHGLDITIENAKGHERSGVDKGGKPWSVKMPCAYGYFKRTEGRDGDHVDVYLGPHTKSPKAFVIDQKNAETGRFDEHKTFLCFASEQQVRACYAKAFSDGKAHLRLGHIEEMTVEQFKHWLENGDTTKPIKNGEDKKLPHAAVGYVATSPHVGKYCGACSMFVIDGPHCTLVSDPVRAAGYCKRFARKQHHVSHA